MVKSTGRPHEPMHLDAGALGRVDFLWTGDRYQHHWKFAQGIPATAYLTSVESTADAVWPVSPPLQQVHLQSFDDGREVIFGVGMSGRGHWSASFTMVPELKCWIVEFACRSPLVPERLGCVYEHGSDWKAVGTNWQCQAGSQLLTIEAIAPTTMVPTNKTELTLTPGSMPTAPATTQWAYRLKIG